MKDAARMVSFVMLIATSPLVWTYGPVGLLGFLPAILAMFFLCGPEPHNRW